MQKLLPDSSPKSMLKACGLGAASSSCSYAATAIAKSLFKQGADFTASIGFEVASTNLVLEIGILLFLLLGWQFMAAEALGGLVLVFLIAILFRLFLSPKLVDGARSQVEKGLQGRMEGHAAMDMSVDPTQGSLLKRLFSAEGLTATSHYFVMDLASVWVDIAVGLLIAGALAAWVPSSFWNALFLTHRSQLVQSVWSALVGPLVAMASFVCSVGNVPLAAVLWKGGISFGGVVSFMLADLIIPPILNIYRRYYGAKMMVFLLCTLYAAMVVAGLLVDGIFSAAGLVPVQRVVADFSEGPRLNYTAVLNAAFLVIGVFLGVRFFRTDGKMMLAMMEDAPGSDHCSSGASSGT